MAGLSHSPLELSSTLAQAPCPCLRIAGIDKAEISCLLSWLGTLFFFGQAGGCFENLWGTELGSLRVAVANW